MKKYICFLLCILFILNTNNAKEIKTSESIISFYKEKVKQTTKELFETDINQIVGNDLSQEEKNQLIYTISSSKASSSIFVKEKELIYSNSFKKSLLPFKDEYTINELLSALSTLNKKNTSITLKGNPIVSDLYKNIEKNYYVLKVSADVRISVDNDEEDETIVVEPMDVYFKSIDDKGFFIYAIEYGNNNDLLSGSKKITPTKDTEEPPGAFIVLKVNPVTAKILIDGNEYNNVYGQKVRVEKGQHIVEIKSPNDKYEDIEPKSISVPTDISTVVFEESLQLNKGQLSVYPASVCVTDAVINIYKVKEDNDDGSKKKKKKNDDETNITKRNYKKHVDLNSEIVMNLPFEKIKLYPGNYIAIIHKDGYMPDRKLINFNVISNNLVTRTIDLKDNTGGLDATEKAGWVVLNIFTKKGENCPVCKGSGACKRCNNTRVVLCNCCQGKGNIMDSTSGNMVRCSTCNGTGHSSCTLCSGSGRCSNCKGSGKR